MSETQKNKGQLTLIIIYLSLLVIALIHSFFAFFVICGLPIVFTLFTARSNIQVTLLFMLLGLSFSVVFENAISVPVMLVTIVAGGYIGYAIRMKHSAYETWAKGTIGFIIGFVLLVVYNYFFLAINIFDIVDDMVAWYLAEFEIAYSEMGFNVIWESNGLDYDEFIGQMHEFGNFMKDYLLGIVVVSSIGLAFVTQWISYKIINQLEVEKRFFPVFRYLSFPKRIIYIYLFVLIFQLAGINDGTTFHLLIVNLNFILIVLMIIQGLSFVVFYPNFKQMHLALQIIIPILFIILLPLTGIFLILLGIIDIGFSLKRRMVIKRYNKNK